ncbi:MULTISPECIES: serine/threonine-protein kinase [unclassified Enterococcus]|uniref:serine/threonine-protein kinase n=1 Tax=unclassified Enterococcus TaxID=2608891 RepID=UPI001552C1E8|nr:serine/threonine protein kinase [Enterococcus sp. MMGLQ5-2]MBS7583693.1 serine/threonine protein kinase [Enterococcus sp. MMGLQ5-1]NPD11554.1 serine/threonine protein kinase [Enterococcus sp. MMGLQ5-1]NPD36298.1 serine/threonine protein kinase [Enterococcus sp. MMGLQ5-2]
MRSAKLINNRYQLIKAIGQGGMSRVYLALDCHLNKKWAIKVIDNQLIINQALQETELMKKIDHHLLPRIVDVINDENKLYIVMDYIEGMPLNRVIERYGPQTEIQVINWTRQICQVLNYLHQLNPSVIYCDLKPENIILKRDGTIRLIDLGIACEIDSANQNSNQLWGTKRFSAPEQLTASGAVDIRTDIYCLGMTMSCLLSGKEMYHPEQVSKSPLTFGLKSSNGLTWIIKKATQRNPNMRYSTILDLARDLKQYQSYHYRKMAQLRGQFMQFLILICLGFFSLAIGLICIKYRMDILDEQYYKFLKQAKRAEKQNQQLTLYQGAIELQPQKKQAYIMLINNYRQDGVLTAPELIHFKKVLDADRRRLEIVTNHGDLAYQFALFCWYAYERPKERIEKANFFLLISKRYHAQNSSLYYIISYYQKLARILSEIEKVPVNANSKTLFISYWQVLAQLDDAVFSDKSSEPWHLLKLEEQMITSLESSLSDFRASGVKASELVDRIEKIIVHLDSLASYSSEINYTSKYLKARLKALEEKIIYTISNG